jgi:predicted O-methyltransferase YrrM
MWKLGEEKGRMLENIVAARDPDAVLELGTFLGYSAIRIARTLRSEAHLTCIEGSSEYAAGTSTCRPLFPREGPQGVGQYKSNERQT